MKPRLNPNIIPVHVGTVWPKFTLNMLKFKDCLKCLMCISTTEFCMLLLWIRHFPQYCSWRDYHCPRSSNNLILEHRYWCTLIFDMFHWASPSQGKNSVSVFRMENASPTNNKMRYKNNINFNTARNSLQKTDYLIVVVLKMVFV